MESDTLELWAVCVHGVLGRHLSVVDSYGLSVWCPGNKVTLRPCGSLARTCICRTCGSDHGQDGCDNPDFNSLTMYIIVEEDTDGE